ncbi:helix-turn-helix domain-containing protein [Nocardia sp. NPDC058058]|uniref:helix-turn-helix domain-containing protein n=1 Tax=Nocardia sp. NPDC058058 TaxID=3346317 RepID=UPI0036DDDE95
MASGSGESPIWGSARFRQLLADGQVGLALSAVRREMGLSQADLGELLHWDRSHVGRVERGEVDTLFDIRELLRVADVLGVPRAAFLPVLLGTANPWTIEMGCGEGVDDVDRRQFGIAATMTLMGAAAPVTTASGAMLIGTDHVTALRDVTEQLWDHDNRRGGGAITEFALQHLRLARRMLDHGEYGPRTGDALAAATGRLCSCAGWLAHDSGHPEIARWCYTESMLLAEQTGDGEMLAAALGGLTITATDHPRHGREPIRIARRVTELANSVPSPRLKALRLAREAVAHAAIGDHREFTHTMTRVWHELERGFDNPDDPIWLHFVTEAELRVHEARGRKLLGQHTRAADLFRDSIDRAENLPRDEASYRAYFAASLAGLGDSAAAIGAGHGALDLLESQVDSPRLVAELRPVRRAAAGVRGSEAEHFGRRFDALIRAA